MKPTRSPLPSGGEGPGVRGIGVPQVLLILAAFLAPVFGGYVSSDQTAVDPGGLLVALGDSQVPILQHALIALPVFVALALLLAARRVQQIPHPYVASALTLVVAGLAPAVAISSYRAVAVDVWMEWAAYAVAFLAAVSGLGRRVGPKAVLAAVFTGSVWVALKGVLEYGTMRGIDPTWRVFAGWSNPNATAAMLTLGFFCGLALLGTKERLAALGVVVGGGLVLFAIFLTGSKGATLFALPLGVVAYALVLNPQNRVLWGIAALALPLIAVGFLKSIPLITFALTIIVVLLITLNEDRQTNFRTRVWSVFGTGAVLIGLLAVTAVRLTNSGPIGRTPGDRVLASAKTQDQSATFRLNLWKSAATLAKERPLTGWGLGSYRYESARPGLATATVFAHNSYLQLAAEAGGGALGLFLVFLGLWAWRALRGATRLPDDGRLAFSAAVGGVVAVLAHCMVDSDLSYFGIGLAFFLVLGAATLLAADAVAPEFVPRNSRLLAAGGIMGLWIFFAYLAWGDVAKSEVRFAQSKGASDASSIEGLAGWDGDAAYLWAIAQGREGAEAGLKRAFDLQPTPKIARALAKVQESRGAFAEAESALFPALLHDPNNLKVLYLLMQVRREAGDEAGAQETARRLVAVEETPYFKIRSLDELVPTETYLARIVLAEAQPDPARKATLLAECVRGLRRYADRTAPEVANAAKVDPQGGYAGETTAIVREKLGIGVNAAKAAEELFRGLKDERSVSEMADDAAAIQKAIP